MEGSPRQSQCRLAGEVPTGCEDEILGHTGTVDLVERKSGSAQRHPWEVARAEFFLRLLRERGILDTTKDWLDVGAGDAWFATQLRRVLPLAASLTCWDVNYSPDDLANIASVTEGVDVVSERPGARFDAILMLDVIEHVEDDVQFVTATVAELLAEGGMVLVSVPAHRLLFSAHDRSLRHHRRYSPADCRRLLERAGLGILESGGLFLSLLPVRAVQVLLERAAGIELFSTGVGSWQAHPAATNFLTRVLIADGALSLSLRGSLPGLSYWALCESKRA